MTAQILNTDTANIEQAANHLRSGDLVAFPTETVYGLGADATNDIAVAAIYEAKGRPSFNPLIVHFASVDEVKTQVIWNEWAEKLASQFWPGALTFILPRSKTCRLSLLVSAGLDTVAVRVPAHQIAQELISQVGRPIAAPSANSSGKISPTTAMHVFNSLGERIPYILDGGNCTVGLESSVIDLSAEISILLRPGGVSIDEIEAVINTLNVAKNDVKKTSEMKSPGMLSRHYAPETPIRLNANEFAETEEVLGFGPTAPPNCLNLSAEGNLTEAAANLFAMLHELDQIQAPQIAVMPIPETGLGIAINDRLHRAATRE